MASVLLSVLIDCAGISVFSMGKVDCMVACQSVMLSLYMSLTRLMSGGCVLLWAGMPFAEMTFAASHACLWLVEVGAFPGSR